MAIREERDFLSENERQFLLTSLVDAPHVRADGRELLQQRKIRVQFRRNEHQSQAEVQLGRTRAIGNVHGEIVPPFPDRPTEGFLHFNVELSPMATQSFETGRASPAAVELARIVERGVRECRALDTEALAVVAGEKVWAITCTVHVVDHGGNLVDCVSLAAIAALMHYRRPEVSVGSAGGSGTGASAYSVAEHAAVPLSLHHIPVSVSFCLVQPRTGVEPVVFMDPTDREERVADGRITFTFNSFRELCAVHKIGGVAVSPSTVLRCATAAAARAQELTELLKTEADQADAEAVRRRRALLRGRDFDDATLAPTGVAATPRAEVDLGTVTDFGKLHAPIALRDDPSQAETDAKASSMAELLASLESAADQADSGDAPTLELGTQARDEFEQLAASLRGGVRELVGGRRSEQPQQDGAGAKDSDSDSEEECGVVQSEFAAPTRGSGRRTARAVSTDDDNDDSDEEMDLSTAVKRK